jgi:hypothetical protein
LIAGLAISLWGRTCGLRAIVWFEGLRSSGDHYGRYIACRPLAGGQLHFGDARRRPRAHDCITR